MKISLCFQDFWILCFPWLTNEIFINGQNAQELPLISSSIKYGNLRSHVTVTNFLGTVYIAPVTIGDTTYNLQIDTGSADLWVSCQYFNGADCTKDQMNEEIRIQYGSGVVRVQKSQGTVQLGHLVRFSYPFGVAYSNNDHSLSDISENRMTVGGSQGILGLAYKEVATISQEHQLIDSIDNFSLYLSPKESQEGSLLVINGAYQKLIHDKKLFGMNIPLKRSQHWTIPLHEVKYDGINIITCISPSVGSCDAIIDSGTSFLTAPRIVFEMFASRFLKDCQKQKSGYYICSRYNHLPEISFTLGSYTFLLHPWDYTQVYSTHEVVVQLLQTPQGSVEDSWILGDTFLKVYHTTFNLNHSITFYCPIKGCNGGENYLDFSMNGTITLISILYFSGVISTSISILFLILNNYTRSKYHQFNIK